MACAVSTEAGGRAVFDADAAWRLHPQVSIRPERFGALVYHFGTRRLSFLKNTTLLSIVQRLDCEPSARSAWEACGVTEPEIPAYAQALATLAASSTICQRTG
jgi:putative mycofactocin binding protein MftB